MHEDLQKLIAVLEADAGFDQKGDYTMLALDMSPQMAFDTPIVIVADAKQQSALGNRALGVCTVISNNGSEDWDTAAHGIDPIMVARLYLQTYEKYGAAVHRMPGKILSIFDPKFGALKSLPSDDGAYIYVPNEKFFGTDSVTAQVELAGRKFKVIWTLKVVDSNTGGPETRRIECGSRSLYWKISTTGDGSLDLQDNASNDPSNDTLSADTANSGFPFGPLSSNHEGVRYAGFCGATGATGATADSQYTFNNISITFAALEGQAVGNAMGVGPAAQITLDADAAGHGWFMVKGVWLDLISGYPRNQRVPQRVNGCGVEIYFRKNTPRACGYTGQRAVTDSVNGCAG